MSGENVLTVVVLSIAFTSLFYIFILPLLEKGFATCIEYAKKMSGRK